MKHYIVSIPVEPFNLGETLIEAIQQGLMTYSDISAHETDTRRVFDLYEAGDDNRGDEIRTGVEEDLFGIFSQHVTTSEETL